MKKEFTDTYVNNKWKMHLGESKSGDGSALINTENYIENLLKIIEDFNIDVMVDCSCGDWNWMKEIKEKLPKYIGIDIVEELIEENKLKDTKNVFLYELMAKFMEGLAPEEQARLQALDPEEMEQEVITMMKQGTPIENIQ